MSVYAIGYGKWLFHHYRKWLWIYLSILMLVFLLPTLTMTYESHWAMPMEWGCVLLLFLNQGLALCLPIVLFRYLMNKRSTDLYLPLPFRKRTQFLLEYGFGLLVLAMASVIFLVVALLREDSRSFYPVLLVYTIGAYLFAAIVYSIYTFAVVKCNSFWDSVVAVLGYALLQVLFMSSVEALLAITVSRVLPYGGSMYEFFPMRALSMLNSPLLSSVSWLEGISNAYYTIQTQAQSIPIGELLEVWLTQGNVGVGVFLWQALLGLAMFWGALVSYERRKGEDAEQRTDSKWIYPLLLTGMTGCLLLVNVSSGSGFLITLLVFVLLHFVAERKITLHFGQIALFGAMSFGAAALSFLLVNTQGFHLIHEFYEREEIAEVQVHMMLFDGDWDDIIGELPSDNWILGENGEFGLRTFSRADTMITLTVQMQKEISQVGTDGSEMMGNIYVSYILNNGQRIERWYPFGKAQLALIADYIHATNQGE